MFWIKSLGGTFKTIHTKEVIWARNFLKSIHAWVNKCHVVNFSERAEMAMPY